MPFLKLSKFEQHRLSLFFICLGIAAISWMFFALSKRYAYPVTTIVKYSDPPLSKAFHPLQADHVELMVEGSGWQLLFSKLRFNPKYVSVSLQELSNQNFVSFKSQLSSINREFDTQQRIISVQPDTLYFDFSTRKIKRVPVKLVSNLHFKPQHGIYDSVQLQPEFVTLSGPANELEKIKSWETDTLVLYNVDQTLTKKISLKAPSKLNIAVYPSLITVKLPIDEFTEREIDVPLTIKNNLNFEEVKLLPESVKVKILIALKNYPLVDRKSFEASVDLNNWSKYGYNQLPVKISRFPKFSQLLRVEPQSADFIIQK